MSEAKTVTEEKTGRKTSRRGMLRLAAPAAAGAAALAATGVLRPGAAHAMPNNDGGAMIIGATNHSTNATLLVNDVGPGNDVLQILLNEANILPANGARGYISALTARADDGGQALHGGIGVLGINGQSEITPSVQLGKLLAGVYGLNYPTGATGIGYGVVAHNIGGGAPLWIVPEGMASATATGAMSPGAIWADAGGAIYNYRTGQGNVSGNARLYQLSSVNFLAKPLRMLDTRPGATDAANTPGAKVGAGATYHLQLGGVTYQSETIPAGITGVFGNVTVINESGVGDLAVYVDGIAPPATATLHYNPGTIVSNAYMVGLSAAGKVAITALSSATDVIFDLQGYII